MKNDVQLLPIVKKKIYHTNNDVFKLFYYWNGFSIFYTPIANELRKLLFELYISIDVSAHNS